MRRWLTVNLIGAALLGTVEAAPAWRVLHDPFSTVREPVPDANERAMLIRAAQVAGFTLTGELTLEGRVPGPFLQRGANETAYLYGNGNEQLALLILRNGKPVLHSRLMNSEFGISRVKEAYAVRDIDGDGLRELAVVQEFGDAGTYAAWLNLLDFRSGTPKVIRRFNAQERNCELGSSQGKHRVYRIEVRPGVNPAYRATEFGSACCDGGNQSRLRSGIQPLPAGFDDLKYLPQNLPLP